MKETLSYLVEGNKLTQDQAKATLISIGKGNHSESEIASFLTVYMMREITPEELAGFREAMLELSIQIDLSEYNTIDVCGTGGDEKNTFNISTLTAFVVAGAGIKVVKHGNYAVSSASGSSNMLEFLGYEFNNDKSKLKNELERANFCYLHAPFFHPAMKHVGPIRKALKLKTFFNILGPMINPTKPNNQLIGVYNEHTLNLYAKVYSKLNMNYAIVHSLDGYDEVSLTSDFRLVSNSFNKTVSPKDLGLKELQPEQIYGGNTLDEAAKIFNKVLMGQGTEAQTEVVIDNAAVALCCYDQKMSLIDGVEMARESLVSGKAYQVVKRLIN